VRGERPQASFARSILGSRTQRNLGFRSSGWVGEWAPLVFLCLLCYSTARKNRKDVSVSVSTTMMAMIVKEVPSHLTNQPTRLGPSAERAYSVLMLQPRGAEVLN
jgi:hypothetical protein